MAFVLDQSATFSWPIVIRELQDGGRYRTHNFDIIYNRLPQSRIEEIQISYQRIKSMAARDLEIDELPTRAIAAELVAGWQGITDPSGESIPFSEDAKSKLLDVASLADVIVATYIQAIERAKEKN